jgi:hypothetical protein
MQKMRTSRYLPALGSVISGLILISSFLSVGLSHAETFYVATTGDDDNPGTEASPWRTLQKGVDTMAPGDTLLVRAGSYAGFHLINTGGGTADNPKVIKADPGETVILDRSLTSSPSGYAATVYLEGSGASYITIDGFTFTDTSDHPHPGFGVPWTPSDGTDQTICGSWGAWKEGHNALRFDWHSAIGDNPHHIVVQNNNIYGMYTAALWGNVDDLQLLNNAIHDNGKAEPRHSGWYLWGYGTYLRGNAHLVRGNTVYGNVSVGLRFACQGDASCPLTNSIIESNLIYNNYGHMPHGETGSCDTDSGGYGLIIFGGTGNIIRNNIVYENALDESWGDNQGQWGIHVHSWSPTNAGPNLIYNNTVYNHNGPGSVGILIVGEGVLEAFGGNVIQNNISYLNGFDLFPGEGNVESHNLVGVDPKFVDASAGDFHLQADSAAIDAGVEIGEDSVDYDGIARPQGTGYDIGALEYTSD